MQNRQSSHRVLGPITNTKLNFRLFYIVISRSNSLWPLRKTVCSDFAQGLAITVTKLQ
jgi:hypothetical protein